MMNNIIAPSILAADYLNLESQIQLLIEQKISYIHIDVMDGNFVPSISYGENWVKQLKEKFGNQLVLDVHLMVENPERYIETFANAGADIIGVHVEATPHIHRALQLIKNNGKKAEVVLNPGTSEEAIRPVLHMLDQLLVMTVNPGFGGQKFLEETLDKISAIKKMRDNEQLKFDIEVDGGINDQTGQLASKAGANVFVAGSYIFASENPKQQIEILEQAVNNAN